MVYKQQVACIFIFSYFSGDVKWNFIHGLFENAIYGGRVDNVWDIRVLTAYLHIFFTNEVIGGRKPASNQLTQNLTLPTTVNYQVGSLLAINLSLVLVSNITVIFCT